MTTWVPTLQELVIGVLALLTLGLADIALKRRDRTKKELHSCLAATGLLGPSVANRIAANEEIARSLNQIEEEEYTSIITAADARPGDRWDITIV